MRKKQKAQYRIRNWSQYNAALVRRGSLEVWLDAGVLAKWQAEQQENREPGPPRVFSDGYIEMLLILGVKYSLTLWLQQTPYLAQDSPGSRYHNWGITECGG